MNRQNPNAQHNNPTIFGVLCSLVCTIPLFLLFFTTFYNVLLGLAYFGVAGECPRYQLWIEVNFIGTVIFSAIFLISACCSCGVAVLPALVAAMVSEQNSSEGKEVPTCCAIFSFFQTPASTFYSVLTVWALVITKFTDSGCSDVHQFLVLTYTVLAVFYCFCACCLSHSLCAMAVGAAKSEEVRRAFDEN